jgi:hypothetical protein
MSGTYHHGKDRKLRVQGIRRPTDLRRLAKVLIDLEAAKAEADAERQQRDEAPQTKRRRTAADTESEARS